MGSFGFDERRWTAAQNGGGPEDEQAILHQLAVSGRGERQTQGEGAAGIFGLHYIPDECVGFPESGPLG